MFFENSYLDERVRRYLIPTRIVWRNGDIRNGENLLEKGAGQATIWSSPGTFMSPGSSLLLDYGRELHGGIQIITGKLRDEGWQNCRPVKCRVRFGESVSEAMAEPNNVHAIHDSVIDLPTMGAAEFGNTGFRFVRIDNVEKEEKIEIRECRAVFLYRDLEYIGSFECDDARLNDIWKTGAYTAHLCLQDYVWDGIKRDRLVWMGDMHPLLKTVAGVFGKVAVVERSLDLLRDEAVPPKFMNDLPAYSLSWVMAHDDWFRFFGDLRYLEKQRNRLRGILQQFFDMAGNQSPEELDNFRYIDWANIEGGARCVGGGAAFMLLGFEAGCRLCEVLHEDDLAGKCRAGIASLRRKCQKVGEAKSANALRVLAGLQNLTDTHDRVLTVNPLADLSPSVQQGYYILQAYALAGDYAGGANLIRTYWGGMLDLGATTFWEHFDVSWLRNAGRIDEMPSPDKLDVHRTYGEGCFTGYRCSFCHCVASAPTTWISEHLLGIVPTKPGFKAVKVEPHLPGLKWLEGSMPTPFGPIRVRAEKKANGRIEFEVKKPKEISKDLASKS